MIAILDLDDRYADVLSITAIGRGGGYERNISVTCMQLKNGNYIKLSCENDDVTKARWEQEGQKMK